MAALAKMIEDMVRGEIKLSRAIREFERQYIDAALRENRGNRSLAARKLGIHRNTLLNKVRAHKLQS